MDSLKTTSDPKLPGAVALCVAGIHPPQFDVGRIVEVGMTDTDE
jgi:hypothetical protein